MGEQSPPEVLRLPQVDDARAVPLVPRLTGGEAELVDARRLRGPLKDARPRQRTERGEIHCRRHVATAPSAHTRARHAQGLPAVCHEPAGHAHPRAPWHVTRSSSVQAPGEPPEAIARAIAQRRSWLRNVPVRPLRGRSTREGAGCQDGACADLDHRLGNVGWPSCGFTARSARRVDVFRAFPSGAIQPRGDASPPYSQPK